MFGFIFLFFFPPFNVILFLFIFQGCFLYLICPYCAYLLEAVPSVL